MHPNPNNFLTVLFSFIPGAGHMYLGLMKRGASIMAAFFGTIAAAAFFSNMGLFAYVFGLFIPVIWFVAFFDFWRYPRMSPEEKALVQDDFFISLPGMAGSPQGANFPGGAAMRKVRVIGGVLLILAGLYQLYRILLWNFVYEFLHSQRLIYFFERIPTLLGGVAVIIVGLLLIFWKSRQLKKEAGEQ